MTVSAVSPLWFEPGRSEAFVCESAAEDRCRSDQSPAPVPRAESRCSGGIFCHVKDYQDHALATLFSQVTVPAGPISLHHACRTIKVRLSSPSHLQSTADWVNSWPQKPPDRLTAADVWSSVTVCAGDDERDHAPAHPDSQHSASG